MFLSDIDGVNIPRQINLSSYLTLLSLKSLYDLVS